MPLYKIRDDVTGRTLTIRGDSPPTEEEKAALFAQAGGEQEEDFLSPAQDAVSSTMEGTPGFIDGAGEAVTDFGQGVKAGFRNIGQDALKLGLQVAAPDMLDEFSLVKKRTRDEQAQHRERSPIAFGTGEIAGEGIALSPIGGAAGMGAKGGSAAFRALVGEGFASGFITSEGDDIAERSVDGVIDAGINVLGGKAANIAADKLGKVARGFKNRGKAEELATADLSVVADRVDEAADYGGYALDGNTAAATNRSLSEVQQLLGKNDASAQALIDHVARQEDDIRNRALDFAKEFGETDGKLASDINVELALSLNNIRGAEEDAFRAAYARLDELATSQNYVLPNKPQLAQQIEDINVPEAAAKIGESVKRVFNKYGVGVGADSPESIAKHLEIVKEGGASRRSLTFGTYEELRKELNSFYGTPNLNNGDKAVIEESKALLDNFMQAATEDPKIGGSVAKRAAENARTLYREFSEEWGPDEIITRIANSVGGGYRELDLGRAVRALTKSNDTQHLLKVKAKLLTTDEGRAVWKSVQQAPLLEAFEKATKDTARNVAEGGVLPFRHKEFEKVINAISPENQKLLWPGGDTPYDSAFIQRAIGSWKMRDRVALTRNRSNPSGTALTLMKQFRFLPQGLSRNIGMAAAGMADTVTDEAFGEPARQLAVNRMLSGEVSQSVFDAEVLKHIAAFEDAYHGGESRKLAALFVNILRRGVVFNASEDEE